MVPRLVKISCGYCIKPETSEMSRFHAIVKVKNFTTFPAFPTGASEGLLYAARVTIGQC